MNKWTPCKRRIFIQKLKKLGFKDPEMGGRHEYMLYGSYKQTIPNNKEYSVPQLRKLINQIEQKIKRKIILEEWQDL